MTFFYELLLTFKAHINDDIKNETEDCNDQSQEGEKDPVLSGSTKHVPPTLTGRWKTFQEFKVATEYCIQRECLQCCGIILE